MSDLAFSCPQCNQHFNAPLDMAGQVIACPSCQKEMRVPAPAQAHRSPMSQTQQLTPQLRFPIIIRSSTRALYAKYVWRAIEWTFGLILVIAATWYLDTLGEPRVGEIIALAWGIFFVLLSFSLVRLWLEYRRIEHTEYRIFPNKIEVSSYLFQFMGAYNNVVNLAQLRQIQANRNSLLDLWFFGCGKVTLTVSGDISDFELSNIHMPEIVRRQIEEIAFGKSGTERGGRVHAEVAAHN